MSQITHMRQIVQVKKQRAHCYAAVDLINLDGSVRKRDKTLVVQFPEYAKEAATPGSLWEVSGKEHLSQFTVNDIPIIEYTIEANNIKFLRPSGRILARWISSNIKGIGNVIANRLVRLKNLQAHIKNNDKSALLVVRGMTVDRASRLIEQWPDDCLYKTISWLEEQKLPLGLGAKLVAIFGSDALDKVKSHPFMLMAMGASFEKTAQVAFSLGLTMDDHSVIAGIAQHVAIKHAANTASTVISQQQLIKGCSHVMKRASPDEVGEIATEHGLLVQVNGGYQVFGTALMESAVAQFLVDIHKRPPGALSLTAGWEIKLSKQTIATALLGYESTLEFNLTEEQRAAVIGAVMAPLCAISGGAGTGKTTILRAVLGVYDVISRGTFCYQVALAGRAAQRMAESTGRPAQTIAKLIAEHLGDTKPDLPDHLLLVVDEASMVDLLSMFRLIGMLPPATRIIFVGDTSQLPPVGYGLVFHALTESSIPFFQLSQVKRQSEQSLIHRFATSVRESNLELPRKRRRTLAESDECSFEPEMSISRLVALWDEAGGIGASIVLSPVKKGEFGVENINAQLQRTIGENRPVLCYQDDLRGWIPWLTSTGSRLLLGDPILIVANNYDEDADLRNGDLGIVTEVFDEPDENGAIGTIEVNGSEIRVKMGVLEKLQLGYAITIHKSQGSQWPTCFVMLPNEAVNMIDQTLIYTASTRPSKRLILMGYQRVVEQAMARGSIALNRQTFLRERIALAAQE